MFFYFIAVLITLPVALFVKVIKALEKTTDRLVAKRLER